MLLRHKVPTIFNIYMLDVICCALGCVILLWQVAHQEAESQTDKARKRALELERATKDLERAKDDYENSDKRLQTLVNEVLKLKAARDLAYTQRDKFEQSLAGAEKDRDAANKLAADRQNALDKSAKALFLSQEAYEKLKQELARSDAAYDKLKKDFAGKDKDLALALAKHIIATEVIDALKKKLDAKSLELTAAQKAALEQAGLVKIAKEDAERLQKQLNALFADSKASDAKLKLTELNLKVREQDLDKAKKELVLAFTTRDNLQQELLALSKDRTDAKGQVGTLTIERDDLKKLLANAKLDKDNLSKRIVSLEAEREQRFEGIPLTGENVVFLIDVSGSMVMKDAVVGDPSKWPYVCKTIQKLVQSIPTLQRFQVITFSNEAGHLFGNRDHWLKYQGPSSAKQVYDGLLQVKVEGGTNMHDGFEEAFRYRKIKLDTIYLISDGLPSIGPGVPSSISKPSEEQKNQHMARYLRDKIGADWNAPETRDAERPVRINAVGFYFESPDVGAFLWALAREHKGSFVGMR